MEVWRLLAHNHWITLNLLGYRLRLCARCSGYFFGFAASFLVSYALPDPLRFLDTRFQLIGCLLMTLPFALDWVTQSLGLRNSSNRLRLATGTLLGVDVFLFSQLSLQAGRTIFVGAALALTLIGYLGKLMITKKLPYLE